MKVFRVLVTGSRTWPDHRIIWGALSDLARWALLNDYTHLTLVHGACPRGADKIASDWVGLPLTPPRPPITIVEERHPANWDLQGKAAGFIRNLEMVDAGADICLAFIKGSSRGATHCADSAEHAGIHVRRYEL